MLCSEASTLPTSLRASPCDGPSGLTTVLHPHSLHPSLFTLRAPFNRPDSIPSSGLQAGWSSFLRNQCAGPVTPKSSLRPWTEPPPQPPGRGAWPPSPAPRGGILSRLLPRGIFILSAAPLLMVCVIYFVSFTFLPASSMRLQSLSVLCTVECFASNNRNSIDNLKIIEGTLSISWERPRWKRI